MDAKDDIAQLHSEYDVVTHQLLAEQVSPPLPSGCLGTHGAQTDAPHTPQCARAAAEADARMLRQQLGDAAQGLLQSAHNLGELKVRVAAACIRCGPVADSAPCLSGRS